MFPFPMCGIQREAKKNTYTIKTIVMELATDLIVNCEFRHSTRNISKIEW